MEREAQKASSTSTKACAAASNALWPRPSSILVPGAMRESGGVDTAWGWTERGLSRGRILARAVRLWIRTVGVMEATSRFYRLGRLMKPSDCRDYYGCSAGLCPLDDEWPIKASADCTVCPYMLVSCRKPVPEVMTSACLRMARDANLPRQIRAQIKAEFGTARRRFTRGTLSRATPRNHKMAKRKRRAMKA